MTFSEWKKILRRELDDLPDDEVDSAIDYYKEMYADMAEAGRREEDILSEFGDPYECADKIRRERGFGERRAREDKPKKERRRFSLGEAVGTALFSLLIFLPIAATGLGIIATFIALAISGAAVAFAGVVGAVASPALLLFGLGGGTVLMSLGACVCLFGVGILLTVGFWLATKYSLKGALTLTTLIYRRV